jgi:hypothetical protein
MVRSITCPPIGAHLAFSPANQGILVVLFFRCIGALLGPTNRMKRGAKSLLLAHSTILFLFTTVGHAIDRDIISTSFIDNREFGGNEGLPPGPVGYQVLASSAVAPALGQVLFPLSQWLADGLLVSSASNSITGDLMEVTPTAVSLLDYLFHELLGYCLPMLYIPRFHRYVLRFSATQRQHS